MAALRLATLAAAVNPPTGQVYEAGSLVALGQGVDGLVAICRREQKAA
jgi:hypothetical protein